jgi:hypothetical protein
LMTHPCDMLHQSMTSKVPPYHRHLQRFGSSTTKVSMAEIGLRMISSL